VHKRLSASARGVGDAALAGEFGQHRLVRIHPDLEHRPNNFVAACKCQAVQAVYRPVECLRIVFWNMCLPIRQNDHDDWVPAVAKVVDGGRRVKQIVLGKIQRFVDKSAAYAAGHVEFVDFA